MKGVEKRGRGRPDFQVGNQMISGKLIGKWTAVIQCGSGLRCHNGLLTMQNVSEEFCLGGLWKKIPKRIKGGFEIAKTSLDFGAF